MTIKGWRFRLRSPLNIGGTLRLGKLRFVCRLWWQGFTQDMAERVWKGIRTSSQVQAMDNKELLHHLIPLLRTLNVNMLSTEDFILSTVEDRLFPEYDGDNVTWENWGWKFKNGMELVYHPELKLGSQEAT